MTESEEKTEEQPRKKSKPRLGTIILSTLAGAFGVQSQKNRERDFEHGNIWIFIVSGIIFTVLFIFTVISVVRFALSS